MQILMRKEEADDHDASPTLGDLLHVETEDIDEMQRSGPGRELFDLLQAISPGIGWTRVRKEIDKGLRETLDVKLSDLLRSGWERSTLIEKALEESKREPGKTHFADLVEHEVVSSYHPRVEVLANGKKVTSISIDVELFLELKGARLGLRDGQPVELRTGACAASGHVSIQGFQLLQKEAESVTLPGVIHFDS